MVKLVKKRQGFTVFQGVVIIDRNMVNVNLRVIVFFIVFFTYETSKTFSTFNKKYLISIGFRYLNSLPWKLLFCIALSSVDLLGSLFAAVVVIVVAVVDVVAVEH